MSTPADQSPLVSVCLITYNHVGHIAQAIESILSQKTNFEFEILLGEDESSDGTRDLVLGYHRRYPEKIKLFLHSRSDVVYINGRATGRWNYFDTLSHASGKYVAFLEGDDFWTDPLKLQKQVDLMEVHPEYSVCGHWVINVGEDGKLLDPQIFTGKSCPEVFSVGQALFGTPLHPNSWLFRKFNLIRHPQYSLLLKLPAADDPMMLVLLGQGNGCCIRENMSAYRVHAGGTWSTKSRLRKKFEMLQFRIAAMNLAGWGHMLRVLLKIGDGAARLILDIARESVRSRSLASIRDLLKFMALQESIPRYTMVLLFIWAVFFLPVRVVLSLTGKIKNRLQVIKGTDHV